MKITTTIKAIIAVTLTFSLLTIPLIMFGQESYIKDRWNIKLGYAKYNEIGDFESTLRIELNYGISDFLETGVYFGAGMIDLQKISNLTTNIISMKIESRTHIGYGVNLNFHILPLFIDEGDYRFDLYLAGRFGGKTVLNIPEGYSRYYFGNDGNGIVPYEYNIDSKFDPEYAVGTGASFYPLYHMGLFAEFYYGKFHFSNDYYRDNFMLRYGLSFKF